jgi:hypothetical protein
VLKYVHGGLSFCSLAWSKISSYASICPEFVSVIDHEMKSMSSFSLRSLEMLWVYIFSDGGEVFQKDISSEGSYKSRRCLISSDRGSITTMVNVRRE